MLFARVFCLLAAVAAALAVPVNIAPDAEAVLENGPAVFDFLPLHVATVSGTSGTVTFDMRCRKNNTASVTSTDTGVLITVTASRYEGVCTDVLIASTIQTHKVVAVLTHGEHHIEIKQWKNQDDADYYATYGMPLFAMTESPGQALASVLTTLEVFFGRNSFEQDVAFLEAMQLYSFEPRTSGVVSLNATEARSSDSLVILKLGDPPHSGENVLEAVAAGGHAGHSAAVLSIDGVLYVCESIGGSTGERNGVIRTPYDEWMAAASKTRWLVTLVRLNEEAYAKWDQAAAETWFKSVEGSPYGYANYLFGWLDSIDGNYFKPFTKETLLSLMFIVDTVAPDVSVKMWGRALNKRLGTDGLTLPEILAKTETAGAQTIYELMAVPEQDDWVYSDGVAMVCDVFTAALFKHGGVLDVDFQATEITPAFLYGLNIYESDGSKRPAQCQAADPDVPYCQLTGELKHGLLGYNTMAPYDNMFETCSGGAPTYKYTPGC